MIPQRPQPRQTEDNVDSWLMSYADMITLLLAFFIIFVSTSEPKHDKLAAATKGMQERFGSVALESPFDGMYREVVGVVASNNNDRYIAVEKTAHGMQMELSSVQLFAEGSAALLPGSKAAVDEIAQAIAKGELANYNITVEGHTSDAPALGKFPSAWELSSARAIALLNALAGQGIKAPQLSMAGYAGTRPALPNQDAAGNPIPANRARNERIVIKVEKSS